MSKYEAISGLEPRRALEWFCDISEVPRVPHKQERITGFLVSRIKELGLDCYHDATGNVVAWKPASPGYENAPSVAIQAHMDVVCEKVPGSTHNFETDPVTLLRDGDKIFADGTTLGADNGLGMAFILAFLEDKNARHPALEAIFTANEETDMTGAYNLDYSRIKSRIILSLDAEAVRVSGNGELEVEMTFGKTLDPVPQGSVARELRIAGLWGGHSGKNAMAERGNAVILCNRVLLALDKKIPYRMCAIQAGAGMSSAIARNATCVITFPSTEAAAAAAVAEEQFALFREELAGKEPDMQLAFSPCEMPSSVFSGGTARRLTRLLTMLPEGVFSRSERNTMESNVNTGVVETRDSDLFVTTLIRSNRASKKYYLLDKIYAVCDTLDVVHTIGRDLPHWEYAVDDRLAGLLKEIYPDRPFETGQGTNECGIFGQNIPGASIIGLGPIAHDPHSPNEHIFGAEAKLAWDRFTEFMARLQ